MIPLTRLNGTSFALNPDLVARADVTPDTVLTLSDGAKYVVAETLADVIALIVSYRASIQRAARAPDVGESHARFTVAPDHPDADDTTTAEPARLSTVVPLHSRRG